MQKMMGLLRRCVEDYDMIADGDKIAVGVSGGKDSLVLLKLMAELRRYHNRTFELEAITIDMGLGMDFSGIGALYHCKDRDRSHHLRLPQGEEPLLHVRQDAPGCPEPGAEGSGAQ